MINVLEALLSDKVACWSIADEEKVYGVLLTTVIEDIGTKDRSLLIYSLYGFQDLPDKLWGKGLGDLKAYAKTLDCGRIIAYTNNARIIKMVKKLGGEVDFTLIGLEV